ncbi:MAG: monovalent cation/H(+) antiporter subunit G [Clostridia bacterium]|nr:monovalent cation/H(+) antiporter subunit G [Clostridia bacterium]
MTEWIRFGFVAAFFAAGLIVLFLSIFGTYRLRFALNRIHSAAMTDTLVLLLFAAALIVAEGFSFTSIKFAMALALQWCTSPLASHMMAKFEYLTDDRLYEHCTFIDRTAEPSEEDAPEESDGGDAE